MVQAKGLTDRAVADIILNNDSEEDLGSDNKSELSEWKWKWIWKWKWFWHRR